MTMGESPVAVVAQLVASKPLDDSVVGPSRPGFSHTIHNS